jgi:hypothetical protein
MSTAPTSASKIYVSQMIVCQISANNMHVGQMSFNLKAWSQTLFYQKENMRIEEKERASRKNKFAAVLNFFGDKRLFSSESPLNECYLISPTCYFVNLTFCQLGIVSTCHFTNFTFHQVVISSTCNF